MPPKAAKKSSARKSDTGASAVNKNWEAGLIKAPFEEDSWKACVSLVVGRNPEDENLIQALALAVQKPVRKLFTVLTWGGTLAKIHELGNPKAKKTDDTPVFFEVTEPAKMLLDAGEQIPCDLMAKIVKFLLLQIKTNDQQRREAEKAEVEKKKVAPQSAGKDKAGTKGPMEQEKKTKLRRRDENTEPPKFIDDEPDDGPQHYVLLLGFYQPHLVGALDSMGVHVANVIQLLSQETETIEGQQENHNSNKENDRPSSVLAPSKEHSDGCTKELDTQTMRLNQFWSGLRPLLDSGPPDSKLHDVAQLSYTVTDHRPPFDKQDPEAALALGCRIFEGVAHLVYDCLDWRRQHQHYLDNIKLINVPKVIVPDIQPAEVVLTPPPMSPRSKKRTPRGESQEAQLPPLSTDVDMRYYNNLLDLVSPESCSVPLILHSMLEQVVLSTDQSIQNTSNVPEEAAASTGLYLDQQLACYILQRFLPLVHTEEERSYLLNSLLNIVHNVDDKKRLVEKFGTKNAQRNLGHPLVIRHHDERALRLRDVTVVQGFDPAEVELTMMKRTPVWELIHSVAQQRNSSSCWMTIKQQLQHYCADDVVSWPEVERLFHHSVFESMPLTTLHQKGVLLNATGSLQTPPIIPWDNPLSYAKQQFSILSRKGPTFFTEDSTNTEQTSGPMCNELDLSDIQRCRLRTLFDWHYTEHHNSTTLPQVLQLASEEYRCMDTFRGSSNNILYIFCHNPMTGHRQCKESWDVALHTNIKFRKYLEHVANTITDWTKEEEAKTEAMQQEKLSPAEPPEADDMVAHSAEECVLEAVIRKDSLKAWKLEQERLKEEEVSKKSKKDSTQKGRQAKEEASLKDNNKGQNNPPLSGKKSRTATACSLDKTSPETKITTVPPVEESKESQLTEEPLNGFSGYNMDGKLVHVSGQVQYLYPSDGGTIAVETVSYVEGSSLMKVAVKKDGHHFYTHINHVVVESSKASSEPQDKQTSEKSEDVKVSELVGMKRKQGSLSSVLDNGVHLSYSFYGPTGEYIVSHKEAEGGISDASTVLAKETPPESHHNNTQSPSSLTGPPQSQACEGRLASPSYSFNSLNLSVPSGLSVKFLREDTQGVPSKELGLLVRQSFPLHGRGDAGQLEDPSLSKELSRTVTSQGTVIRYMRDGSTEVLFADGSVSNSQDSGPVWVPDSEVQKQNMAPEIQDNTKAQSSETSAKTKTGCWTTTTPTGARICTVGITHEYIPTVPLLAFKATDPITNEVMVTREDLVMTVQNPNGSFSVEHADGTRITNLYQDRPPNTPPHILMHTGDRPETVTLKSTSAVCGCGFTECTCVTRCAESIIENVHILDTSDSGEEIIKDSAGGPHSDLEVLSDKKECAESIVFKDGQDHVLARETVDESNRSSACLTEKRSDSDKEKVVLVEKEGCATVVMYPERHMAHVFLADGTVITGNNNGAYQVFPSSVGLLQIHSDGKCVYTSDPLVTPTPKGGTPTNQPGSYTMSHTDNVACDVTDSDGNHFQVMEDGKISVLNFSPTPSMLNNDEEELLDEEEDREMAKLHAKRIGHSPRLFLVQEDGSGVELLSSQTVEELLFHAYSDPTIAVLKEPLPDTEDEFSITILRPSHQSMWSQWLLGKQNPDITPPNLKNRSWHDFPRVEVQKQSPGPPFGTDMGRGLTLNERSGGSAAHRLPVKNCPKVLEMSELYQHRPFTTLLKNTVDKRLKEYIESLMEREQRSEEMRIKDPRTVEETVHASDLLNLVLSFTEGEDSDHATEKNTSVDIGRLYIQGVGAPVEQSDASEDTIAANSDSFTHGQESKWTGRLAQHRQELCEEKTCREALKKKIVVPYFHVENVSLHQNLLYQQTRDMNTPSMDLPPTSRAVNAEDFLKDAPQETAELLHSPRPLNPTPSKSTSYAAGRTHGKRPTHPVPQPAVESSLRGSSVTSKPLCVDVTGKPRRTKVRLPTSILSSKPCSVPNHQFLSVEEPVRRKCRTVSLTDGSAIVRGFQLLPTVVDFGTLQEGTSSTITVVMKNVGVDTCRFHVKQPPCSTGLRVIYNPGPVAAGLQVELQVQLFAMCAVRAGGAESKTSFSQDITIQTETEILYLPVTATILSERFYDIWVKDNSSVHNKRGYRVPKLCQPPKK
ncbi:sperm-associated antigen 17 [Sphaeramia orbicularis]|uniref:sperm-associated antigen 17 n=1 Tax=Sphaeramia orbicularis TaxID=375764 RepID=UPI00117D3EC0|nr:sperm-associated antigen 17 [Sphaeramia orbicularis]